MVLDLKPKHEKIPTEEQQARKIICAGCTQNDDGQCYACACEIDKLTRYAEGKCPLGYW